MCSIGLKSGLQIGFFLILNTSVRLKSISNSCNIECLVRFKSKQETLSNKVFEYEYYILEYY